MKRTIVLCVLAMSAIAHAQQASAPASQDQAPKDPVGNPFSGPQTRFYGPRQPIRLDIKTMIAARFNSIVIAGKTYEFAGSLVPTEDGARLWMGVDVKNKNNTMDLVHNLAKDRFGGRILVDGHSYLLNGQGEDALLVESFISLLPLHAAPPASSASNPGGK